MLKSPNCILRDHPPRNHSNSGEAEHAAMAQLFLDVLYSFGNCLNCFPGSPTLKINSRSFKILRLLGEVRHGSTSRPQLSSS